MSGEGRLGSRKGGGGLREKLMCELSGHLGEEQAGHRPEGGGC